jgi:hypothetical protein
MDAELETWVADAAEGDGQAWKSLWERVEPTLNRLVRKPSVTGRMSANEDDRRNIVVEVMSKLQEGERRRLRRYLEARQENPNLHFVPWLIVVARRIVVDYQRAHGEYIDRRRTPLASSPGKWIQKATLPNDSRLRGLRPQMTNRGAAMSMLSYAYKELPSEQLDALQLWIINTPYGEIATKLELDDPKDAERRVRAALERLRRHFRKNQK